MACVLLDVCHRLTKDQGSWPGHYTDLQQAVSVDSEHTLQTFSPEEFTAPLCVHLLDEEQNLDLRDKSTGVGKHGEIVL